MHSLAFLFSQFHKFVLLSKVFTNSPGDRSPIPGQVIPKTEKNGA